MTTIFYAADLCDLKILSHEDVDTVEYSYAPGLELSIFTVKLKQPKDQVDVVSFTSTQKVEDPVKFVHMLIDMAKSVKCPKGCGERCQEG